LLTAQLALSMNGRDRDQVLAKLVELLATQSLGLGDVVVPQASGR